VFGDPNINKSILILYQLKNPHTLLYNIQSISGAYRGEYICSLTIHFIDAEGNLHPIGPMGESLGMVGQITESFQFSFQDDRINSIIVSFDSNGVHHIKLTTILGEVQSIGYVGYHDKAELKDMNLKIETLLKDPRFYFKGIFKVKVDCDGDFRKLMLFEVTEYHNEDISSNNWID